jgi:hypothetical protein
MFKQFRDEMRRIFISRLAQGVWLTVLFFSGVMFVRHYYWPLYDITLTYVGVAIVLQLFGLMAVFWCYQLTAEAFFQIRNGDQNKRFRNGLNAAISAMALLTGVVLVTSTLFREVGKFTIKLPGVTYFMPGSSGVVDFVAAGRLATILLSFVLVALGTLFCGPVARQTTARSTPRHQVTAGVE